MSEFKIPDPCELTIAELKSKLACTSFPLAESYIEKLVSDSRKGVRRMGKRERKRRRDYYHERKRLFELFSLERLLLKEGFRLIAGVDEVGRGPLAGQVRVVAVVFPSSIFMGDILIPDLNDSKRLNEEQRQAVASRIKEEALAIGRGIAGPRIIDRINIFHATQKAAGAAVRDLGLDPDLVLLDGSLNPHLSRPCLKIIRGDLLSGSIAAASCVAKVERDRVMEEYDTYFPQYGFKQNKGYGTSVHREALIKYGPSRIHRRSFTAKYRQRRGAVQNED